MVQIQLPSPFDLSLTAPSPKEEIENSLIHFSPFVLKHSRFKQLLIDTALEGIYENLSIKLDKTKMTILKKMTYKGTQSSTVIRTGGKVLWNIIETIILILATK